ncbi:dephospho-CoA kinase [Aestuariibacter sp. AA17]|uniref:Dephospho-CoA kinase n=1 Tax=Fluctibacter corallii TaxID=2984329 RepID=A0ABT3A8B5_9ALTE|nr:dephospho-CoA kinase [Aestuariibacter sp. AA17]MCV2884916.1 dephospho-CoA kinase [Aestuariibacter sp. AA17]
MSNLVIGLTGGIGSGKTFVSDTFAKKGIVIIDADVIAREVVDIGTPALHAIVEKFGPDILQDNGSLNRSALRQIVFSDSAYKRWLDTLLHPVIRQEMVKQAREANSTYSILSIPLLVENNLFELVDHVLVVDVSENTQRLRAGSRDGQSAHQIQQIMNNQASREERLHHADDVIINDGEKADTEKRVEELHQKYLSLAKNRAKA